MPIANDDKYHLLDTGIELQALKQILAAAIETFHSLPLFS